MFTKRRLAPEVPPKTASTWPHHAKLPETFAVHCSRNSVGAQTLFPPKMAPKMTNPRGIRPTPGFDARQTAFGPRCPPPYDPNLPKLLEGIRPKQVRIFIKRRLAPDVPNMPNCPRHSPNIGVQCSQNGPLKWPQLRPNALWLLGGFPRPVPELSCGHGFVAKR